MATGYADVSYSKNLLYRLRKQRGEGLYCDFSLRVQDQVFKIHTCILAANSTLIQDARGQIVFNIQTNTTATAVKSVLDFMYTGHLDFGNLDVSAACAEQILNAARALKVSEVENICKMYIENVKYLKRNVNMIQQGNPVNFVQNETLKPLHREDSASSGVYPVNISTVNSGQTGSANTNTLISVSKRPHDDVRVNIDTTSVNNIIRTNNLSDQMRNVDGIVDGVHECEDKKDIKPPELIFDNTPDHTHDHDNTLVTVKMEEPESLPIVWKTSESEGEMFVYKVDDMKSIEIASCQPQDNNSMDVDRPKKYNPALSRTDDIDVLERCPNKTVHVEHSYSNSRNDFLNSNTVSSKTSACSRVFEQNSEGQLDQAEVSPNFPLLDSPSCSLIDQSSEDQTECVTSDSLFGTQEALVHHVQTTKSHKRFARPGKCLHCAKRFLHKETLINHMKSVHYATVERACQNHVKDLSGRMAARDSKMAAKRTQRIRMGSLPCSFCKKLFRSKKTLIQHVKKKHEQLKFKCMICRRAFPSHESLVSHKEFVHKVKISCEVCEKKCNSVIGARNHTLKKHIEECVPKFSCKFCYRKFPLVSMLHGHTCKDRNNLKCRRCLRQCHSYGHFVRHTKNEKRRCYVCEVCSQSFRKQCSLKQHKYSHSQESFYICQICKQLVDSESHLKTHQVESTDSNGGKSYHWDCPKCKKRLQNVGSYITHVKNHDNECDVCGRCFTHPDRLKTHKKIHADHADSTLVCDKCGKCYQTYLSYKSHLNHNMSIEPTACPFCGEVFRKHGRLIKHVRKHKVNTVHPRLGEGKYYKCPKCDCLIENYHTMLVHLRKHMSGKMYSCQHCEKGFMRAKSLTSHLAIAHNKPVKKIRFCSICDKKCRYPSCLKTHMLIHHECKCCGETFEKKEEKVAHEAVCYVHGSNHGNMETHASSAVLKECKICGATYRSRSGLREHMMKHSGKDVRFECKICGVIYISRSGLRQHMTKHSAEGGRFECKICGSIFRSPCGLRYHLKRHMGEGFRGQCNVCGVLYHSRQGLKRHMMKHSAETFQGECNICGAVFDTKNALEKHLDEHLEKGEVFEGSGLQ